MLTTFTILSSSRNCGAALVEQGAELVRELVRTHICFYMAESTGPEICGAGSGVLGPLASELAKTCQVIACPLAWKHDAEEVYISACLSQPVLLKRPSIS